jgi:hypothetical protein
VKVSKIIDRPTTLRPPSEYSLRFSKALTKALLSPEEKLKILARALARRFPAKPSGVKVKRARKGSWGRPEARTRKSSEKGLGERGGTASIKGACSLWPTKTRERSITLASPGKIWEAREGYKRAPRGSSPLSGRI